MVVSAVSKDPTFRRLVVGIVGGLALGLLLEVVLVLLAGSAYLPVVFAGILLVVLAVVGRWSWGLG
jgi:hypothetical protein